MSVAPFRGTAGVAAGLFIVLLKHSWRRCRTGLLVSSQLPGFVSTKAMRTNCRREG